jgi:hypothetical protein
MDWESEDVWAGRVTREADAVRSIPGHGLTDRQAYLVAGGRVAERHLVRAYRFGIWGGTILAMYVGAQTWHASGSFRDSLAPMAVTMLLVSAIGLRLTRRMRWAGFDVGPYAREVETSLRRAQGGVHLLRISGYCIAASFVVYILCVSWAFPLT